MNAIITILSFLLFGNFLATNFDKQTTTYDLVGTDEQKASEITELLVTVNNVQFYIDKSFSENQKKVIAKASHKVFSQCKKATVIKCALKNAHFSKKPKWEAVDEKSLEKLFTSIAKNLLTGESRVYILEISGERFAGKGWLNIVQYEARNKTYYIGLNPDLLSGNFIYGLNFHYWAGIIAHEMLHNVGYDHPEGIFQGTLIVEWDECMMNSAWDNFDPEGEEGWIYGKPDDLSNLRPMPVER